MIGFALFTVMVFFILACMVILSQNTYINRLEERVDDLEKLNVTLFEANNYDDSLCQ